MENRPSSHLTGKQKLLSMKKSIWIFALLVSLGFTSPEQSRTITGNVTDVAQNQGMPGVNVLLKGTKISAVTDVHGDYSISAPPSGGTLVFSFVGYITKEVKIDLQD